MVLSLTQNKAFEASKLNSNISFCVPVTLSSGVS